MESNWLPGRSPVPEKTSPTEVSRSFLQKYGAKLLGAAGGALIGTGALHGVNLASIAVGGALLGMGVSYALRG